MKLFSPTFGSSLLALLVSAPAAFAEIKATDVWAQWQDYAARSGMTLTASGESRSGDTTTFTNVTFAGTDEEVTYTATLSEISLREDSDGMVVISLPVSYPVTLEVAGDEPFSAGIIVSQENLSIVAEGEPGNISYGYAADGMGFKLTGTTTSGADDATLEGELSLAALTGSTAFGAGALQPFASEFSVETADLSLGLQVNGGQGQMSLALSAADLAGSSEGAVPEGIDPEDLGALLRAGLAAEGALDIGAMSYSASMTDGSETFELAGDLGSTALSFGLSADVIGYMSELTGLNLTLSGNMLPVEALSLSLETAASGMSFPLMQSDEPQDFSYLTKVTGLQLDPELFDMFDPEGSLSRDPISFVLDIAGQLNWLLDLTDDDAEEQMAAMEMPAELHSLNLNALEVTALGSSLTGEGAFTFNNDDMASYGGFPAPAGKLELQLVGASKLIDTLVNLGVLSDDEEMMARMGMGMFATPGEGEDTLVSTIEITEDGSIFANGQQLQ